MIPHERWDDHRDKDVKTSKEVEAFLKDIMETCIKHNISICHEDENGAFRLINYDSQYMEWFLDAHDGTKPLTEKEEIEMALLEEKNTLPADYFTKMEKDRIERERIKNLKDQEKINKVLDD